MLTIKKILNNKIWISGILALLISIFIIPITITQIIPTQFSIPTGSDIRSGNRIFYNFLKTIKQKDNILVLGTSETGNRLNGNNYYSILSRDKRFNKNVYAFGGAGRSANVYFPLILDKPEFFKDLNIIYYINPTYWRKGLNKFNSSYFNRYVDSSLVCHIKDRAKYEKLFENFMDTSLLYKDNFEYLSNRIIDNFKSIYYHDLDLFLARKKTDSKIKRDILSTYDSNKISSLKKKINLEFNSTDDFLKKNSNFPAINSVSNYQYELLLAFIRICKKYEINCTFYLGPYNEIYCQKVNPDLMINHRLVLEKIKKILINNNVEFIDGTKISTIPGTFMDIQHISEYGAFLTALQIKEYYEKAK
jgi:hypothetical protein